MGGLFPSSASKLGEGTCAGFAKFGESEYSVEFGSTINNFNIEAARIILIN